jgi:glycerol-3-phosphate dehydrogenase
MIGTENKMVALPLFDIVLSSLSSSNECRTTDATMSHLAAVAECAVASSLADLAHLRGFDACLSPADAADVDPTTSDSLRALYDQWVRDADALLERISQSERLGATVVNAERLRDELMRERTLLGITRNDIESARCRFNDGRSYTLEEVRRELRLGV